MTSHGNNMALDDLLRQPFATLPELMRAHARERPDLSALINDRNQKLSFLELDQYIDRITASLQRAGVQQGDSVAICAANSLEYVGVFVAVLRAGAAVAPLTTTATAASLERMLDNCGANLLFLDESGEGAIELGRQRAAENTIALTSGAPGTRLQEWLAPLGSVPTPVPARPEDCFNVIYSSGTTGTPKGILHSNGLRWPQIAETARNECRPGTVSLVATPLYSNTTLVGFLPALGGGSTVLLMSKFDAGNFLRLAEHHRATHTMLVPIQYQRLMRHPEFDHFDLSSFRLKTCTSAPFSAELKTDILKRWPGGLVEFYGMTEGGGSCVLIAHEHPDKLASVGCPMPGHDIRVIDEQGQELQGGEIGEVVGRSAFMMTGYNKAPEKTAQATWHDQHGNRFIRTGDLGRFDKDGFLFIVGRAKDTIISGGFNIYPGDIEAVLAEHPQVLECAVTGVPSERWGETPIAVVVTSGEIDCESLRDWANSQLGKTQRITDLTRIDALPRNGLGKVTKLELRERYLTAATPR